MKILVVTHDSNFSGGANRSLYMVLKRLKNTYHVECDVLLPKKHGELNKKLEELEIPYFSVPYFGVVSGIRNDGKDLLRKAKVSVGYYIEKYWSRYLFNRLKAKKYDLVYTNTRLPILGALLAEKLRIPHVIHVREFLTEEPLLGKWGYEQVYQRSNRVILISEALKEKYEQYVPSEKLMTIHNGIDSPLNLKPAFEKTKTDEPYHIIITGRLVPDKGQLDAIKAIEKIVYEEGGNIHLHIVGSSPKRSHITWYAKEIQDYVTLKKLSPYVTFHGEVNDMVSLREKMDIELMCAIRETFGRVTVEGMRSGLFLIGSNTGGTLEIITDHQTGLLYEQGSVDELKEKIKLAISNKELYKKIASNGYHYSQLNFTPKKNVEEIYHVFKEVLDEQRK